MKKNIFFSFVLCILITPHAHSADGTASDSAAVQSPSNRYVFPALGLLNSGTYQPELDNPDIDTETKDEYRRAASNYDEAKKGAQCPTVTTFAIFCMGFITASAIEGIVSGSYTVEDAITPFILGPLASTIPAVTTHKCLTHRASDDYFEARRRLENHPRARRFTVVSTSARVAPAPQATPTVHPGATAMRAVELRLSAAAPSSSSRAAVDIPQIDPLGL
ncbi:hypothetical protein EBQ93_02790 [bacterium]|nr:hypothetical protein [bacterium]